MFGYLTLYCITNTIRRGTYILLSNVTVLPYIYIPLHGPHDDGLVVSREMLDV